MKQTLHTISDVIDAFGGTRAVAMWTGLGESAISMWMARGEIPPGWHYRLHIEALARGFEIDPCVFDTSLKRRSLPRHASGAVAAQG